MGRGRIFERCPQCGHPIPRHERIGQTVISCRVPLCPCPAATTGDDA